ncbi:MgtC/SapB family protein [Candidatus Methylospira mobilis]|uniref:Protein MgtC n=1 Tax=Candidatus Methylospira mobilis TaxID=1808979 RepID=A0A5Q0BIY7_9GAMM|nr:MgtC/SapB family protein [Candidatus Methylospira mobilis]QFY43780.1 MgtC/SapB family protein [Candidatus Methylospira mobilis]WNV04770.1 MgtC/SapB family protein [Candidatus Methylospira mobilis]
MDNPVNLLFSFWTLPQLEVNAQVFLNILGALLLGLLVGYERSYHGRAAGMRTYGLVCMASAALTAMSGYPHFWYGGLTSGVGSADPTRVIQGIVTGIGFLGAGVIMKEGYSISGLSTAASIWCSSVIGILMGVGFYLAALLLALLSVGYMTWGFVLERLLPGHQTLVVSLKFRADYSPQQTLLNIELGRCGYRLLAPTLTITANSGQKEWRFTIASLGKSKECSIAQLSDELSALSWIESFELAPARN